MILFQPEDQAANHRQAKKQKAVNN